MEQLPRRIDWREPWLDRRILPWLLAGTGAVALVLRMVWIERFGLVIENEGTAYTILARSLREGLGYIGVLGGRHTLMPPLFPYLIVLVTPLAGSEEMAARWISCLAGVLMLWPAFVIARLLAGLRAGIIAAGLFAVHGLTLGFSGATYSEGLFFCLLFFATVLLLGAIERGTWRSWIACGLVYGLSYLVRPDTIAYLALAAVYVLWRSWAGRGQPTSPRAVHAGLIVLLCALVIAPYVYWLSTNSGHFRLEGKSDSNGLVNERMATGMSYEQASRGLDANLRPAGPDLMPEQFGIPAPDRSGLAVALSTVMDQPFTRAGQALHRWVRDPVSGGVMLMLMGLGGMVAAFVRRERNVPVALLFLCMTGGYLGLILSVRWFIWDRYVYPFTFFMLIWGAVGVSWCIDLLGTAMDRFRIKPLMQAGMRVAAISCLAGGIVYASLPARYAPMFFQAHDHWAETLKDAGQRIRASSTGHPLVLGISAVTPYYAGGYLRLLPWVPEDRGEDALAFVHQHEPDFIVLRTAEVWVVPYTGQWLEQGIPDRCAREFWRAEESPGEQVVIYEWDCSAEAGSGEGPDPVGGEVPAQHDG